VAGSRRYLSQISFYFFAGRALSSVPGGGSALLHSTRERVMRRVFITAMMFLGIAAVQGQTVSPTNSQISGGGQTNGAAQTSSKTTAGSVPVSSSSSSASSSSGSSGSQAGYQSKNQANGRWGQSAIFGPRNFFAIWFS